MNCKIKISLICTILSLLLFLPGMKAYAQDKTTEQYTGEVEYDDTNLDEMTDEEMDSYQPKNCDTYYFTIDSTYTIHAVIEHDDSAGSQDGYVNLNFSEDELYKGQLKNVHISNNGCENNTMDITLDKGTYQMQVSLRDDCKGKINYLVSLSYTKVEATDDKQSDDATLSFSDYFYNLEIENCKSYEDAEFDFFEDLKIESKLQYKVSDITWKSSDTEIADVDKNGTVTAYAPGSFTLTATLPNGNTAESCILIPKPHYTINKKEARIYKGKKITLKVTADPKNQSKNIQWSSSNENVATVIKSGIVYAKKAGTCTITAKMSYGKVTCKVTVLEKSKVVDISDYLNNAKDLSNKKNNSFVFKSKNGKIIYAKITDSGASFRGIKPGGVNTASLFMMDYELISTEQFTMGETSCYRKKSTGEEVYITEVLMVITEIEYYRN